MTIMMQTMEIISLIKTCASPKENLRGTVSNGIDVYSVQ